MLIKLLQKVYVVEKNADSSFFLTLNSLNCFQFRFFTVRCGLEIRLFFWGSPHFYSVLGYFSCLFSSSLSGLDRIVHFLVPRFLWSSFFHFLKVLEPSNCPHSIVASNQFSSLCDQFVILSSFVFTSTIFSNRTSMSLHVSVSSLLPKIHMYSI